jgi:hypothetical protein
MEPDSPQHTCPPPVLSPSSIPLLPSCQNAFSAAKKRFGALWKFFIILFLFF